MTDSSSPRTPDKPLANVQVIEIGHSVAAPYCGQILADLGARVIKVENPNGGDDARLWGPPFVLGTSATFQSLNRNKESIALDFKKEEDCDRFRSLAAESDVVIQNMRPGLVERFRIDADSLRALLPELIYCNLGAFGTEGPLNRHTGYDPLVQAFSGIMSVTGEAGRPPVRVGPSLIDQGTGLWCVVGILAALFARHETRVGMRLDTSLFETALSLMTVPIANAVASGKEPKKSGSETPMLAPYRAFRAKDRHIVIAAGNNNLFHRLCETLGQPDWATDERFLNNSDRVANRQILNERIADIVATEPADHWAKKLDEVGVPCAQVNTVPEVLNHPQTQAVGMLLDVGEPNLGLVATPLKFNGLRPGLRSTAPATPIRTD